MVPETALSETLTMILLVPAPEVIVHPAGRVHVYEVAFEITGTDQLMPVWPWHTWVGPTTDPAGDGNGLTVMAAEEDTPLPQKALCPATVRVPDWAERSNEMVTELVPAPEVTVAPGGRVHT